MSRYTVFITPEALAEVKGLPGNLRQRVKKAITKFGTDPRPSSSKVLEINDFPCELRRLRLDRWRIIYVIDEENHFVDILAIRKRPPYDYGDQVVLLENFH